MTIRTKSVPRIAPRIAASGSISYAITAARPVPSSLCFLFLALVLMAVPPSFAAPIFFGAERTATQTSAATGTSPRFPPSTLSPPLASLLSVASLLLIRANYT